MKTKLTYLSMAAVMAATPAAAATYGIHLQGHVPVACHVNAGQGPVLIDGDLVDLGNLHEFCNAPAGYDVYVDYSPDLAGAKLLVDGSEVLLTDEGSAKFDENAGPARLNRNIALDLSEAQAAGGALSFRIVAR